MLACCCCSEAEGSSKVVLVEAMAPLTAPPTWQPAPPQETQKDEDDLCLPADVDEPIETGGEIHTAAQEEAGTKTQPGVAVVVANNHVAHVVTKDFAVMLKREQNQPLGVGLDIVDEVSAVVEEVDAGGCVAAWNLRKRGPEVLVGDMVVEVNGVKGDAGEMIRRIKTDRELKLLLRRPTEHVVCLGRPEGRPLGVQLHYSKGNSGIRIVSVAEGLVHDYNEANPRAEQIKVGDRIVEVNGVRGTARQLMAEMQNSAGGLNLTILTYRAALQAQSLFD